MLKRTLIFTLALTVFGAQAGKLSENKLNNLSTYGTYCQAAGTTTGFISTLNGFFSMCTKKAIVKQACLKQAKGYGALTVNLLSLGTAMKSYFDYLWKK